MSVDLHVDVGIVDAHDIGRDSFGRGKRIGDASFEREATAVFGAFKLARLGVYFTLGE
jgi:hypothetical protein